jgi:hypothetical protein
MIPNRNDLTKIFLNQWNVSADEVNVKFYSRKWWHSFRTRDPSYRLSEEGYKFLLDTLNLTAYTVPFNESIEKSPQTMIFLSRYINCPYYLTHQSITVFSEIKSFELHLFSDDIRKYGLLKAVTARNEAIAKLNEKSS